MAGNTQPLIFGIIILPCCGRMCILTLKYDQGSFFASIFVLIAMISVPQSPEEGAISTIFCAVSEEMEGVTGKYVDSDCTLGLPAPVARDPALAVKAFEMSERVVSKLWNSHQNGQPQLHWTVLRSASWRKIFYITETVAGMTECL